MVNHYRRRVLGSMDWRWPDSIFHVVSVVSDEFGTEGRETSVIPWTPQSWRYELLRMRVGKGSWFSNNTAKNNVQALGFDRLPILPLFFLDVWPFMRPFTVLTLCFLTGITRIIMVSTSYDYYRKLVRWYKFYRVSVQFTLIIFLYLK